MVPIDQLVDDRHLLTLAEAYQDHTGRTTVALSKLITNGAQAYLLSRLKTKEPGQRGILLDTYKQTLQWFSDNWPEEIEWPSDIIRPTPIEENAVAV